MERKTPTTETASNGSQLEDASITLEKRRVMWAYKREHEARERQQRSGTVNPLAPESAA